MGGGHPLWVLGVVRGAGLLFLGAGLSIVGAGARWCEHIVRGCWFVDCGRGGDVSCAGWSPLARWDGVTHQTTMTNDDIIVVHCLVATSPRATWHLQTPPTVLFHCDVALFGLAVVVVGMGDGCEWRPLAMVTVVVMK